MSKFRDEADDYDLRLVTWSPMAWGFKDCPAEEDADHDVIWLPKSVVELGGSPVVGRVYCVTVPNWMAEDKGLI